MKTVVMVGEQAMPSVIELGWVEHMAAEARKKFRLDHVERRVGKKIGRNEPCPCGSGKKYKKCCLR